MSCNSQEFTAGELAKTMHVLRLIDQHAERAGRGTPAAAVLLSLACDIAKSAVTNG